MLESASYVEPIGDTELTLNLLGVLEEYFGKEFDKAEHPENYDEGPEDEV